MIYLYAIAYIANSCMCQAEWLLRKCRLLQAAVSLLKNNAKTTLPYKAQLKVSYGKKLI